MSRTPRSVKPAEMPAQSAVLRPLTREELLATVTPRVQEKVVKGVGLVRYRRLSFSDHYALQAYAEDATEFAARCIVAGFVEPKMLEEDIPALKAGLFGPIAILGALPLEREDYVKEEEVAKPQSASDKTAP